MGLDRPDDNYAGYTVSTNLFSFNRHTWVIDKAKSVQLKCKRGRHIGSFVPFWKHPRHFMLDHIS